MGGKVVDDFNVSAFQISIPNFFFFCIKEAFSREKK